MKAQINIKNDYIYISLGGAISWGFIYKTQIQLLRNPRYSANKHRLWDIRTADLGAMQAIDTQWLDKRVEKSSEDKRLRVAILTLPELNNSVFKLIDRLSLEKDSVEIELFDEYQIAKKWLCTVSHTTQLHTQGK